MQVVKFHASVFLKNNKGIPSIDDELNDININRCTENNIESISQSNINQSIAIENESPNKYNILINFLLNEKSKGNSSIINHML